MSDIIYFWNCIGDEDEIEMPLTLQDSIEKEFNMERHRYQAEIDALKQEIENSQQAFDKYRDRARVSLLKVANEQQETERKLNEALALLKVSF